MWFGIELGSLSTEEKGINMKKLIRRRFNVLCRRAIEIVNSYDVEYSEIGVQGEFYLFGDLNVVLVTIGKPRTAVRMLLERELKEKGINVSYVSRGTFLCSTVSDIVELRENYRRIA